MVKSRRPKFVRQESWRYGRLDESWRKPRGKSSRIRRQKRGWPELVKVGYKGPVKTRHMHPSGLREVAVHRPQDLEGLNPKTQAVRIAHTVGERKRVTILERAKEMGLKVLNPGKRPAAAPGAEEFALEEAPEDKTAAATEGKEKEE